MSDEQKTLAACILYRAFSDFPKLPNANITLTPEQEAEIPMWADENGHSLLPHNKGEQVVTIIKNEEAQP